MKESPTARRYMTIRVPYGTYAQVRDLAISEGITMAEVIRRATTDHESETQPCP